MKIRLFLLGFYTAVLAGFHAIVLAVPGDENWDAVFSGIPGVNGAVTAIGIGNGNIYVGGPITAAGNGLANIVARWDGKDWHPLGGGIKAGWPWDAIRAMTIDSQGRVYVGGKFYRAGDVAAQNIACWDESNWSALGTPEHNGVSGQVRAIAVIGTNVFVGGEFELAGDVPAQGLARWDGYKWHSMKMQKSAVNALAVIGDELYAGGVGGEMDSTLYSRVARWDGTQWHQLGDTWLVSGGVVEGLAADGSDLYAVGDYEPTMPNPILMGIARWDGQQWLPLLDADRQPLAVGGKAVVASEGRVYASQRPTAFTAWMIDGMKKGLKLCQIEPNYGLTPFPRERVDTLEVIGLIMFAPPFYSPLIRGKQLRSPQIAQIRTD